MSTSKGRRKPCYAQLKLESERGAAWRRRPAPTLDQLEGADPVDRHALNHAFHPELFISEDSRQRLGFDPVEV